MKKRAILLLIVVFVVLATLAFATSVYSQSPTADGVKKLQQDAGNEVEITWNPQTGTASFIRGLIPLSAAGLRGPTAPGTAAVAVVDRYASLFGVKQATRELNVVQTDVDELGMKRVTQQQVYQGVEVYNAFVNVHLSADGLEVVAISSGFVPDIRLADTRARVNADQALATAKKALPNGKVLSDPKLVIYPGTGKTPGASAKLAWLVELRDDAIPARNVYVVDAIKDGILHVLDRLYIGRSHETYDANHGYTLPGTLKRSEGDGPTGDQDIDNAHDFAGATYDYYYSTYSRDSYDNQGATIISTSHYGSNYMNAFWNGEQMVYGDGFAVNDVVAHELTHAVTEKTANLEYRWQSGALNESFSDIFGAMVDRDDWLIGEDLPPNALGGREAIRDMANPKRFGQPDHTKDWVETCSDNEGVHTNSGITNKAYYNIATAIGKDKAERIFYRTLTVYLQTTLSLEDARAGALQSAQDLYGYNTAEYNAVRDGFNAVGLDGQWNPEPNDCTCAAATSLTDRTVDRMSAIEVAATLYRVRDQLLSDTAVGQHYRTLYERHTGRISYLLLRNADLRSTGARILQQVAPGLRQLVEGKGDNAVVTQEMVTEAKLFLQRLAQEDRATGGENLARTIEQEMQWKDWDRLVDMTFKEAWVYINSRASNYTFSPNRVGGASGYNNERDADTYPAVAYDSTTGRYLAVWMTARNAGSSSAGFDVYGVFLDQTGQPVGSEFRISDSNTAARNALPAVAAGNGEFAVAWTARGTACQIVAQRVTDTSARSDRALVSGSSHHHSPNLVYNSARQRYALVFVEGDDYLPSTFFGAQTADCGNNASSTSGIRAIEFYFSGESPVGSTPIDVSGANSGAFRPCLAYSAGLNQYLAAWEDRRNADGQPYRFDVYAQRLGSDLTVTGSNISLATGGDYANYDTSATWTPRPVVAEGSSNFLAAWFTHEAQGSAVVWSVKGSLVQTGGTTGTPFTIAQMPFAQPHPSQSPTGFLAAAYLNSAQGYMVGMTSHLESLWGYFSVALVQRVSSDGHLLNMDGSALSIPGVGRSVDYENDDQISVAIAVNPASSSGTADYMVLYGKHPTNGAAQDFDIWGVRIPLTTAGSTFADVSPDYWAASWIERLYNAGITGGCGTNPLIYCPENPVTRAQMAIFLERGMRGSAYTPPPGSGTVFADVSLSYWAVDWIEKLYADGITKGCLASPLTYCPDNSVTRAEMALFLLRAKHDPTYTPPPATGIFADVPTTYWAANWIEQFYAEGITGGCKLSPLSYCPDSSVTRAEMAVFLVSTFTLP